MDDGAAYGLCIGHSCLRVICSQLRERRPMRWRGMECSRVWADRSSPWSCRWGMEVTVSPRLRHYAVPEPWLTRAVPEQLYGLHRSFPWRAGAPHSDVPYIRVKTAIGSTPSFRRRWRQRMIRGGEEYKVRLSRHKRGELGRTTPWQILRLDRWW